MACADADVLGALLADELSPAERAQIVDHAAACDRCRAVIELVVDGDTAATPRDGDDRTTIAPGTRVGRYVIDDCIGAGGMGVVYAAVDSELHRRVAVKVLRGARDGALDSRGRERLLREARTLARLSHPNVVTVYDVGMHGEHLFVAMELVEGGSLTTWLRGERRPLGDILDRLQEAGQGLAAAHAAGVVHRDVKPDNILVGADGRARMTDFGLARVEPERVKAVVDGVLSDAPLTTTHALVGTPLYMAPEQLMGTTADARSDQWSFCATLYEAVAGVRPFPAEVTARSEAIDGGTLAAPQPGRRVPGWLERVARRGLRAAPDERWPSVAALVAALAHGRSRRRRVLLAVAAAAVLAVGGVAATLAFNRHPTAAPADDPTNVTGRDGRGTCNCPFSACVDGVHCLGVCRSAGFRLGARVPGINLKGRQEALAGASLDGDAILFTAGERCNIDHLWLARRHGDTFVPVDLTARIQAKLGAVHIIEGCCTLARDGRSIVLRAPGDKLFVRLRLGPGDEIAQVVAGEFAQLTMPLDANQFVIHPVLTADERTLYFLFVDPAPDGDFGPLHGTYASIRADPAKPFPPAHRMPGRARNYSYPTGVSPDNLTLFMAVDYTTRVLVRSSPAEPFGDLGPTLPPAPLYGWRALPLGTDCSRILTTDTPGGCAQEDIVYLEPIDR